jgi:hypothetical protein
MISGMSAFTLFHVGISLLGIFTGLIAVYGMLRGQRMDGMTAIFLLTTILTSVTGFMFPFHKLLPSHILGVLSLILLAFAVAGRYAFHLNGAWRKVYAITAVLALWLNVFVFVAQLFQKSPALHPLAPTGSEPPFLIAQTVVMVIFIGLTVLSAKKFQASGARA